MQGWGLNSRGHRRVSLGIVLIVAEQIMRGKCSLIVRLNNKTKPLTIRKVSKVRIYVAAEEH